MPELTTSSLIVAVRDQLSSNLGGETVILHMGRGVYHGLSEVGTRVWALIQEPTSVGEICRRLLGEFDVDEERCRRAVLDLLREMEAAGLIERTDESAA